MSIPKPYAKNPPKPPNQGLNPQRVKPRTLASNTSNILNIRTWMLGCIDSQTLAICVIYLAANGLARALLDPLASTRKLPVHAHDIMTTRTVTTHSPAACTTICRVPNAEPPLGTNVTLVAGLLVQRLLRSPA